MTERAKAEGATQPSPDPAQADKSAGEDGARWKVRTMAYVALLAIVVALSLTWLFTQDVNPTTNDAQVDGHVIVVSPRVSGYVARMNIDDNTVVRAGDVLIQLDPADYQARVDRARAAVAVEQAKAASLKITVPFTIGTTTSQTSAANAQVEGAGAELDRASLNYARLSTSELKFAEANLAARRAEMEKADLDVQRTQPLAQQAEISHQQYDAYVAAAQVARNNWLAAEQRMHAVQQDAAGAKASEEVADASLLRAKAQLRESRAQELQAGVRKADYQSALAEAQQARAELEQAELDLSYTTLRSPVHGEVTRRTVEPGQQFAVGQAMFQLVPLDNVWVTANFKETQLARVRPGQHVRIRVDAYSGKNFDGVVDSIASSTGSRQALLPPENATGNFVKVVQRVPVKIVVNTRQEGAAILRPGMNVEAKIHTNTWDF